MDINLDKLLYVNYACFVLYNFCEVKKEIIGENKVSASIAFDKHFQPPPDTNNFFSFFQYHIMRFITSFG